MKLAAGILFVAALFLPSYSKWEEPEDNMFTIYLNGENVGVVGEEAQAEELLQAVRRELVSDSDEMVFMDVDMNLESAAVLWGKVDDIQEIKRRMREVLASNIRETMHRSYVVKVNNYMVNLASREQVVELLQTAVDQYDTEGKYQVELIHENSREFDVLTAVITDTSEEGEKEQSADDIPEIKGGVEADFGEVLTDVEPDGEKDFDDYELGLAGMNFAEEVEIVEAYLDVAQLTPLEQAIEEVIKEQEVNAVYEVVSGDTLSEIAIKVNIPMDQIVAMNYALESTSTTISVGQALIIT
ncbi:MAG: LysM peptidoglycan-binding domain-containing protein, partial [Lachnospiraceae bacterium]|nr:LysM peptidoglycan-binding domain-containing protein [Lachnospiraceae bacterium]